MYFVFYHPLKHKLRTDSLGDREALPYLIIYAVLFALGSSSEADRYGFLSLCLTIIIVIGGTYYAYLQNGGKEGSNLIKKYLILGWVVSIRFAIVLSPVVIVHIVALPNLGDLFYVLFGATIKFIYYQRLGTHIRDTRTRL